jgi:Zn-dependent protease
MKFGKSFKIGDLGKLEISMLPSAALTALLLWALFSLVGVKFLKMRPEKAVAGGLLATFLHFFSEWWHQMGHAKAAEQTGYPMKGMVFWGPLATSKYPANEGLLSPDTHIQRALGGPIFSLTLAALTGILALMLRPFGGPAFLLALYTAADNFFVFTIGALTPLGFTDGSTILEWFGNSRGSRRIQINN